MAEAKYPVKHPDLKGSEQHHDLKGNPGEKGDDDHAKTEGTLDGNAAKTVDKSDADTQIAEELRQAKDKS